MMAAALPRLDWRRALLAVLSTQLLFWGCYALIAYQLDPTRNLSGRLPMASAASSALVEVGVEPAGAYAPGLLGPALLRIPGWYSVVLYPARASLLAPAEISDDDAADTFSLTCLVTPCGNTNDVYAGAFEHMDAAASREQMQRYDLVWLTIGMGLTLGVALLILLPLSRSSRIQIAAALFLILMGVDAWLITFGAMALPYAWFPLLRYGIEYLMLMSAALGVNAFTGWCTRGAKAAVSCCAAFFVAISFTLLCGYDLASIAPWLDTVALLLLSAYGFFALQRLGHTAPGPALRIMTLLFIGLTAMIWDLLLYPLLNGPEFHATFLERPLLMLGILLELAVQGHRLNQEADESHSDIERQVLEQDANLLRSSSLLRHQERQIAINIERQRFLRDMHDGVGGMLTHLMLGLRERNLSYDEIKQGLQAALDDLRNIASAIDADHGPIDEALAIFHERMAARLWRSGIAFDWHCRLPIPAPSLDARRLLNLQRLLQEGIANVLRHADASRIELTAEATDAEHIAITLSDDGSGFDPTCAKGASGEGCGLTNMRRRAEQMGGKLRIESAPGQGSILILTAPV
ncbi:MAG: hypothetical protein LBF16_12120 [Pseudomonadales bacterium]|jgi:signal transduction histidine kinase|nr:hypothetical protein [Pseudomonadales bacterium]